jgi:heat shock protein HtpX
MAARMPTSPPPGYSAPAQVLVYDRIGRNKRNTALLMLAFFALFGVLGFLIVTAFQLPIGALGVFGVALIIYALFSYFGSTSAVLSISGAHEVTKQEEWEFVRRTENLCIGAGLPMPRTWVIEDSAPNAFATGISPQKSHVVVTRGLLEKLEPAELEGVLAHELSHIGNFDIRVMTVVAVLVGLIALVSDLALRFTMFGAGGRSSNKGKGNNAALIALALTVVAAILAPLVAQTIRFAVSRQREYLADASGALLARNPGALARALEKIRDDKEPLEVANKATAHLYISNPLKEHASALNSLFSTHPDIDERIRILRNM